MSTLSLGEQALIEAQWIGETDPDFQCVSKAHKEAAKHDLTLEDALARQRTRGRCENRKLEMDNGVTYHKCFCNFTYPYFDVLYQVWSAYDKGILPFSGTLFDQPAWVFDAIHLFNRLKFESQERERARQEKEIKSKNKR